jgi:hypothetical protein
MALMYWQFYGASAVFIFGRTATITISGVNTGYQPKMVFLPSPPPPLSTGFVSHSHTLSNGE